MRRLGASGPAVRPMQAPFATRTAGVLELHVNAAGRGPSFLSRRLASSATAGSVVARVPVRESQFLVHEYLAMVRRRPVVSAGEENLATPAKLNELTTAQPSSAAPSSATEDHRSVPGRRGHPRGPLLERQLKQAFDAMDTDRSGSLDKAEVRKLLLKACAQGSQYSEESLDAAMAELDQDHNGLVSYKEFQKSWRSLENRSSAASLSPLEQALASGVLSSVSEYQAGLRARR